MSASPNFLYIGTSKAGSTWIFKVLSWHSQIYMYPGKDLGFFTSGYEQGWDWYVDNFNPDEEHQIVGEVSHSYMISRRARDRILQRLPDAKLLVCLREPVERTFSQYLDGIKNGKFEGTFEEVLESVPSLINRSRYGTHISRYLEAFSREQMHIASFDQLKADPAQFAADMFAFLGVEPLEIPPQLGEKVLPAATPRNRAITMTAKKIAEGAKQIGLDGLRGKVKTSPFIRNLLYKPFTVESRPTIAPETKARLRDLMAGEVQRLDAAAGTYFCSLWNYPNSNRDLAMAIDEAKVAIK